MSYKKLVPIIYLKDTKAYSDEALTNLISDDAVSVADSFSANGADEIIIMIYHMMMHHMMKQLALSDRLQRHLTHRLLPAVM